MASIDCSKSEFEEEQFRKILFIGDKPKRLTNTGASVLIFVRHKKSFDSSLIVFLKKEFKKQKGSN